MHGASGTRGRAPADARFIIARVSKGLPDAHLLQAGSGITLSSPGAGEPLVITATGAGSVPTSRTISTTAPLTGGGDLSANRTLAVSNATTGAVGVVQLAGQIGGTATSVEVTGLRETGGPTLLTMGAVADGQALIRSGSSVIGGVSGVFSQVAKSVLASNQTNVDFTGLSGLGTDECYVLIGKPQNAGGADIILNLYLWATAGGAFDTTATNYYTQFVAGDGVSATAARSNNARIITVGANAGAWFQIFLGRPGGDGFVRGNMMGNRAAPAALIFQNRNYIYNSNTDIIGMRINSETASGLGTGSAFWLYKIKSS